MNIENNKEMSALFNRYNDVLFDYSLLVKALERVSVSNALETSSSWEEKLRKHIDIATAIHPKFCGMDAIYGELHDLENAVQKGDKEDIMYECIHLATVAIRMYMEQDKHDS